MSAGTPKPATWPMWRGPLAYGQATATRMRRGIPEVILGSPYNALAWGFRCQGLGRRSPMAANGNKRDAGRTGIVRHIDELGRIVIPSEIRKRFGFGVKDPVE